MRGPQITFSGSLYDIETEYRPPNGFDSCIDFMDTKSGLERRGSFNYIEISQSTSLPPPGTRTDYRGYKSWVVGDITYTVALNLYQGVALLPHISFFKTVAGVTTFIQDARATALPTNWEMTAGLDQVSVVSSGTNKWFVVFGEATHTDSHKGLVGFEIDQNDGTILIAVLSGTGLPWYDGRFSRNLKAFALKGRLVLTFGTYFLASETGDYLTFDVPATITDSSPIEIDLGILVQEALEYNEGFWISSANTQRFVSVATFTSTGIQVIPISTYPFRNGRDFGDGIIFHDGVTLRENLSQLNTVNTEARDIAYQIPELIKEYKDAKFATLDSEYALMVLDTKALVIRRQEQRSAEGKMLSNFSYTEMTLPPFDIEYVDVGILAFRTTLRDYLCVFQDDVVGMDFSTSITSTFDPDPDTRRFLTSLDSILSAVYEESQEAQVVLYDTGSEIFFPIVQVGSNFVDVLISDLSGFSALENLRVGLYYESSVTLQEYIPRSNNGYALDYDIVNLKRINVKYRGVDFVLGNKDITGVILGQTILGDKDPSKEDVNLALSGRSKNTRVTLTSRSMFPLKLISYTMFSTNTRRRR